MIERALLACQRFIAPQGWPGREIIGHGGLAILIAVVMLVLDQFGIQSAFYRHYTELPIYAWATPGQQALAAQFHFSASCLFLFVLLPLVYDRIFPLPDMNRYGVTLKSHNFHLPLYAALLLVTMPVVWIASGQPAFARFYPMYKPAGMSDWMIYELSYMLQFFAVEFFFRGFCLFRMERAIGLYSVPMMVIPYAFLHIHKPLPEALGSIIAGLALGYMALRTRSIWPGLFLHASVAFGMDAFVLARSGWF